MHFGNWHLQEFRVRSASQPGAYAGTCAFAWQMPGLVPMLADAWAGAYAGAWLVVVVVVVVLVVVCWWCSGYDGGGVLVVCWCWCCWCLAGDGGGGGGGGGGGVLVVVVGLAVVVWWCGGGGGVGVSHPGGLGWSPWRKCPQRRTDFFNDKRFIFVGRGLKPSARFLGLTG